jgi:HD-GYP domain-containing protein (c-di-GMP phosphodiesterase class II)
MASTKRPKSSRPAARSATPSGRRIPQARTASSAPPGLSPVDLLLTQQQLTEAISAAIQNGRSMDAMVSGCLRVFLDRTGIAYAAVYFEDEQTKDMRVLATCGDKPGEEVARVFEPMVVRVMRENRALATAECLAAPLKRRRSVEGVVAVYGLPKDQPRVEKIAGLLDFYASRLAEALDHVRLIEKYAQKIKRIRQMEEVSQALNSSDNEIDMLRQAINAAIALVHAEAGSLLLRDESSGELFFRMAVGEKGELLKEIRLKLGQGVAGLVAQSGKPLLINDAQHDPRVAHDVDLRTGFVTKNMIAVPIPVQGAVIGVIEAVNKRGGKPFSKWDLDEFAGLSHQVALALEKTRLYREHHGKIGRLQKLQEISGVLNSSLNPADIRKKAIEAATIVMNAETGSLLLMDEAAQELYFDVALGEKGAGIRQIRLKVGQGIAGAVAKTQQPEIINDCYSDPRFNPEGDKKTGFRTRNMVCVPVKAKDKLLGVLQAINKKDAPYFTQDDLQDFVSLANQVGIAIDNANLYEEINRLLEGFINASVLAIESRDPTTSGHSGRVATLCGGLAEVLDRLDSGPFKDVAFNYDQMKELRYAAVLHDFGKVGVREHVLIKAEKLFPGDLAQMKARFDFIKRTYETKALRKKVDLLMSGDRAATAELVAQVDEELAKQIAETDGILEFLLACNRPTVLAQGGFDRLNDIAKMTYESYGGPQSYLTPQEAYTLSIQKGSLTKEERLEIESHVTHTYRFLSTIPWTKTLKNIPEIAYGHHEKLDGTGYPRQVPGTVIPVQTRIMTISDIYDALTASDRPYKAAVPTPKALAILEDEVKHGKVDSNLFQVFVDSKVYQRAHASS